MRFVVAAAGEGIDPPPLGACDLCHDMARRSEAVDSDRLTFAGHDQRPPANQAGAKQGCNRGVISVLAKGKTISRIGDQMTGKAAVARVAGELRAVAKVFLIGTAITGIHRR